MACCSERVQSLQNAVLEKEVHDDCATTWLILSENMNERGKNSQYFPAKYRREPAIIGDWSST